MLILESGAGGYVAEARREQACQRVMTMGSSGWLFRSRFGGYAKGRRRRRNGQIIELVVVRTVGTPDADAMAGALLAAGKRHGVTYQVAG
ncbi:hypothetical protein [Siccirubricoccus deserti]|uniref:Uncharacterized protein n=1 Tax=Siccirubricoccus deserti TaxID=2013562 RepID=A0A9X0UFR9_9PROT|nr:hypothetical protein [Siccirubricoccus deserti]MBC4019164.1 hypothetical protein [Siccirubricoccus deserti]